MEFTFELNYLAVLVSALFMMVLGGFWFSPVLFGAPWMDAVGIDLNDIEESGVSMGRAYAASTLAALCSSLVLAVFVSSMGLSGFLSGVFLGLLAWLGFNFSSFFKLIFWEGRPGKLFLIDAGYDIICFCVAGGLLAAWK